LCDDSMEYQEGRPLPGHAPATAFYDRAKTNFQTSRYRTDWAHNDRRVQNERNRP
jgi:hypothetical protein